MKIWILKTSKKRKNQKKIKMGKKNQNVVFKNVFITKISKTLDFFWSKIQKENRLVFLGAFTWNHPFRNVQCACRVKGDLFGRMKYGRKGFGEEWPLWVYEVWEEVQGKPQGPTQSHMEGWGRKRGGGGTVGPHPMLTMLAENNKFVINALRGDLSTINVRPFSVPNGWACSLIQCFFYTLPKLFL